MHEDLIVTSLQVGKRSNRPADHLSKVIHNCLCSQQGYAVTVDEICS